MLIDVTRLVGLALENRISTGLNRVALAYVLQFRSRSRALVRFAGRWIEFDFLGSQRIFDALLSADPTLRPWLRGFIGVRYVTSWSRSNSLNLVNADCTGLDLEGYGDKARFREHRCIFFLHDLLPLIQPEFFRAREASKHHRRIQTVVHTGRAIVLNSESTFAALRNYAMTAGWQLPPTVVAPIAPATLPAPMQKSPLSIPYFIVVGTIEPRKNHLLLLKIWRRLVAELGERAPRLIVIGQRGWECEQVVDMLERCPALRGFVFEESNCDDAQLSTWLHHSQALLFPTFAEGYGLPLVEALAHGVPAIASDLEVFREFAGEIPEYLDPLDGPGWIRAILDYADSNHPRRLAQLARMRGYRAPTWEQHFEIVEQMMREHLGWSRPSD